jgi:hypothetical protein
MPDMYLNGKGEPVGSQELSDHAQRIRDSKRSEFEQKELDLIWHDDERNT